MASQESIIIEPSNKEIRLMAEDSGDADNLFNHPDFALFAYWQREKVIVIAPSALSAFA